MNLDRFNLNLFVALDAVLSARNLTEAAKSIFLTQPALSVALKKLRQHYGDELVIYAGGETKLTPLAEELKPRIKELIQASKDTLKLSLRFDPSTSTQTFRMVTTDILELTYMKDVLGEIAREAPGVTVILLPFAYEPVEMLFRGNVDLTIVSEAFGSERFAHEPLFEDTFSCVIWEGNSTVGETLSREDYFSLRHAALYQSPERLTHPFALALNALSTPAPRDHPHQHAAGSAPRGWWGPSSSPPCPPASPGAPPRPYRCGCCRCRWTSPRSSSRRAGSPIAPTSPAWSGCATSCVGTRRRCSSSAGLIRPYPE